MKILIFKIKRKICLFLINTFFCTTNFFGLKRVLLKISGISVGKKSKIVGPISIGTIADLTIGDECWIGSGLKIHGNGSVIIGDRCDLAPDISFVTGSHEIGDVTRRAGKGISFNIFIANGCWIGARSTIVGDVIINPSSIIGACSLVNKIVLKNKIVVGIPARVVKELD